jgi:hypothetical protein
MFFSGTFQEVAVQQVLICFKSPLVGMFKTMIRAILQKNIISDKCCVVESRWGEGVEVVL